MSEPEAPVLRGTGIALCLPAVETKTSCDADVFLTCAVIFKGVGGEDCGHSAKLETWKLTY